MLAMLVALLSLHAAAAGIELDRWPAGIAFPTVNSELKPVARGAAVEKRIAKPEAGPKVTPSIVPGGGAFENFVLRINIGEPSRDQRIVGIAFIDSSGIPSICSGLYLDALHILTAKHCTCHRNSYKVTNDTSMLLSSTSWTRAVLEPGFQAGKPCFRQRDFDAKEGNDIAILTLEGVLKSGNGQTDACYSLIENIELLDHWKKTTTSQALIAGYGSTSEDGRQVGEQSQASVPINSFDCASRAARSLGCVAYREMIMSMRPNGIKLADSCRGDSGGPAFLVRDGKMIPVGVISRGLDVKSDRICGAGGIYTLLGRTDVIRWINKRLPRKDDPLCRGAPIRPIVPGGGIVFKLTK
jgi:hypothetical protein